MKTRDFEPKIRPFLKVFEKLTGRQDAYTVFQDYTVMCLNYFGNGNFVTERDIAMKKYKPEEHKLFNELFTEMVMLMGREITTDNSWYDPFGNFYQAITSTWKSSAMGQFFTPEIVVDFMVKIINGEREGSKMHFTASEPACGSGRFIIAAHAHNPMGFYWAIDLDNMCAQMTAVNMALHNCCGVVLHANGLWEDKHFYRAYHIARIQLSETEFVPCIYPIATYEEAKKIMEKYKEFAHYHNLAYHFREYTARQEPRELVQEEVLESVSELQEVTPEIKQVITEQINKNNNQLSLF